jgi:uncharacterized membrane protein
MLGPLGVMHVTTALAALLCGLLVALRPKGGALHRLTAWPMSSPC